MKYARVARGLTETAEHAFARDICESCAAVAAASRAAAPAAAVMVEALRVAAAVLRSVQRIPMVEVGGQDAASSSQ